MRTGGVLTLVGLAALVFGYRWLVLLRGVQPYGQLGARVTPGWFRPTGRSGRCTHSTLKCFSPEEKNSSNSKHCGWCGRSLIDAGGTAWRGGDGHMHGHGGQPPALGTDRTGLELSPFDPPSSTELCTRCAWSEERQISSSPGVALPAWRHRAQSIRPVCVPPASVPRVKSKAQQSVDGPLCGKESRHVPLRAARGHQGPTTTVTTAGRDPLPWQIGGRPVDRCPVARRLVVSRPVARRPGVRRPATCRQGVRQAAARRRVAQQAVARLEVACRTARLHDVRPVGRRPGRPDGGRVSDANGRGCGPRAPGRGRRSGVVRRSRCVSSWPRA